MGNQLSADDRHFAARPAAARFPRPLAPDRTADRALRPEAPDGRLVVEDRDPGNPQLRRVLSALVPRRVSSARKRGLDDRGRPTGLRDRACLGYLSAETGRADAGCGRERGDRARAVARAERSRTRYRRGRRRLWRDRHDGDRNRLAQALGQPSRAVGLRRMATRDGRRDAGSVCVAGRSAAAPHGDGDRRLCVSRIDRNCAGLRVLVPRRRSALAGRDQFDRRPQSGRRDRIRPGVQSRTPLAGSRYRGRGHAGRDRARSECGRRRNDDHSTSFRPAPSTDAIRCPSPRRRNEST